MKTAVFYIEFASSGPLARSPSPLEFYFLRRHRDEWGVDDDRPRLQLYPRHYYAHIFVSISSVAEVV